MNFHLFKNASEGNIIESKQKRILKSLDNIIILNPKRFKKCYNIIPYNKISSTEKDTILSYQTKNSTNTISTVLNSNNFKENNSNKTRNKNFLIKKGLKKLHSSRPELIFSKDKNTILSQIEKEMNNKELIRKEDKNKYFESLKEIDHTFNEKRNLIKKQLEKIKTNGIRILPNKKLLEKEQEKVKESKTTIENTSNLLNSEKNKYLNVYAHDEIDDDTTELKKTAQNNDYISPEFGKTKFADKDSYNVFFEKVLKNTEIIRKGGLQHQTPSFNLIRATKKLRIIPNPIGVVKKNGEIGELNLKNKILGDDYIKCVNESLKVSKHISSLNLEKNRLSEISLIPLMKTILNNNSLLEKLLEINLSYNKIGFTTIELLVKFISEYNCSLENLNMEGNNLGVVNAKKIIEAISNNLKLSMRYLNLSKNILDDEVSNELSILIKNCVNLNVLILYQNQFSNKGGGILMSEIKKHNNLKILDLSWNLLGTNLTDEIPTLDELLKASKNKNDDENDTNPKNHFINAYLDELKYTLKYRRNNSTSPERKGSKVSYFTSQLCSLFHNKHIELLHLDLSYNNLNYIDCKAISDHIKYNHTILGIHVDGNDMYTDGFGFVYPIEKTNYKHDHFAKSQIFYRISDDHPLISSNVINLKKLRAKNNCWICEGWREIKFNYKPTISQIEENYEKNYVKIYLHFENYKNINLNELDYDNTGGEESPNFFCYRVCPPGDLYFFLSRNGIPITNYGVCNHQLKDAIIYTEDIKPREYEDEKIEIDKNNLKKYIITKVAHRTVKINPEVIDNKKYISKLKYCVPRPIYKRNLKKREKIPWSFNNSIWSCYGYNLEGETQSAYDEAFEFDYERCNFDKEKDLLEEEKDILKNIIKKYYKKINETYKNLSAYLGWKVWQIGQNQITEFAQTCSGLIDNKYLINDFLVKVTEVKANAIDKLERKKNPNIPDNIIRHQFLMLLVKIAKDKYFRNRQIEKLSAAVEYAFEHNYQSYLNMFDNNKWRIERYYLEEIDNIIRAHMPIFDAVFFSYAPQQIIGRKDSYWLTLDNFSNLCNHLIDKDFPVKEIPVIFNLSIRLIKDEIHSDKQYNMIFPEFLEAICRFTDKLSPIPNNEDPSKWNMSRRQSQSLFQKLETMIPRLVVLIKGKYKNVKDKFILPIKDKETGLYIINYENPFYEGKIPMKEKK